MDSKCKANDKQLESKEEEKKGKERKRKYNTAEIEDFFESVWELYPNKKDKAFIKKSQKEKLFNIGYDELKRCIDRYIAGTKDPNFYKYGSTFFNTAYSDYLDSKYEEEKPIAKQEVTPAKEEKSRFAPLTEEERKMFFDRGAFMIDEDGECVDFSELTEEERIYLQKKGVI
jgi:hypothetical protein